jgi:protease I
MENSTDLSSLRIAILATDGVEQIELTSPRDALEAAGAEVDVVSPKSGQIQGYNHHEKGDQIDVDAELEMVNPQDYDALVLPGGVVNPDTLRINDQAIAFIRSFVKDEKPIAAICHGPWTLIDAEAVHGKRMTSWPSLKTDLTNAGATWEDETVIRDDLIVTSRKPDDLPDFNREMVALFAEQKEAGTHAKKADQPSVSPGAMI